MTSIIISGSIPSIRSPLLPPPPFQIIRACTALLIELALVSSAPPCHARYSYVTSTSSTSTVLYGTGGTISYYRDAYVVQYGIILGRVSCTRTVRYCSGTRMLYEYNQRVRVRYGTVQLPLGTSATPPCHNDIAETTSNDCYDSRDPRAESCRAAVRL